MLCEAVHILSGKLYILGGALATWTMALPGEFPPVVALVVETEPDLGVEGDVVARLVSPTGTTVAECTVSIVVGDPGTAGAPWVAPIWLRFDGVVLEPGRYEVVISIGGSVEARLPITILPLA